MQFTITLEQIYFGIFIFVSLMQVYLIRKIDRTKDEISHQNKEIQKIWEQIGIMASTIAIKHLELEKEVSRLKEKIEKE
jgi:membrane protein implicated in regulation of membrane protease activity